MISAGWVRCRGRLSHQDSRKVLSPAGIVVRSARREAGTPGMTTDPATLRWSARFDQSGRKVSGRAAVGLRFDPLTHGLVEGQAQHLGAEVDGVAGEVAVGPAPVAVFHDQAGILAHGSKKGVRSWGLGSGEMTEE